MKTDDRFLPAKVDDETAPHFVKSESWEKILRFQREMIDDFDDYLESDRAAAGNKVAGSKEEAEGTTFSIGAA